MAAVFNSVSIKQIKRAFRYERRKATWRWRVVKTYGTEEPANCSSKLARFVYRALVIVVGR